MIKVPLLKNASAQKATMLYPLILFSQAGFGPKERRQTSEDSFDENIYPAVKVQAGATGLIYESDSARYLVDSEFIVIPTACTGIGNLSQEYPSLSSCLDP